MILFPQMDNFLPEHISGFSEDKLIDFLTSGSFSGNSQIIKSIGDDTAVISCADNSRYLWLFTQDSIISGRHYLFDEADPYQVGWKAMARNLSDIAAMGGLPVCALCALALPSSTKTDWLKNVYRGINACALDYNCPLVGGDLSSSSNEVFISLTILGKVDKNAVRYRIGAKKNDLLCVTGSLGGSLSGKHLRFKPRINESRWIIANLPVTSMIDLSDGLAKDIHHIAKQSGVGFDIVFEDIPVSEDALRMSNNDYDTAFTRALNDGEDYELLFTVSPDSPIDFKVKFIEFEKNFNLCCNIIGKASGEVEKVKIFKNKTFWDDVEYGGFEHFKQ